MKRRDFLTGLSISVSAAALTGISSRSRSAQAADAPAGPDWRKFEITTSVDVAAPAGRTRLWLPVPLNHSTSYQRTLSTQWDAVGASRAELLRIAGYDVVLLCIEWPDPKSVRPVTLTNRIATRDRRAVQVGPGAASALRETSAVLQTYLRPTSLLPTDGIVRQTADTIVRGCHGTVEQARAIYEWVVDNTNRDPATRGCGMGDVATMLKSGYLGGKCADINGLFVALARAVGIPARDAYGIRVADSRLGFKSLGRSGDISKAQHCRAEFFDHRYGWIPVDPADVRKVILEEVPGGLPMNDPKVLTARAAMFGSWEMNWVAYNHGHDVTLPGSGAGTIPFLMYPNGESAAGRLDSLDPTRFRYEIRSRELRE
jgi:transglutaminase-like putative cysteine protease